MTGILRPTADASPLDSFRTTWVGPRSRAEPPHGRGGRSHGYSGYSPFGVLAFEATPTDCQTGVSAAGIEGVVGLGKQ
jgi:hypothetical protein